MACARAGPVVIGIGNPLMGDDGVGPAAATILRERAPEGVRVLERDLVGIDALPEIEDSTRLLVIDCIEAGLRPGAVFKLRLGEAGPRSDPVVSPHETGIEDLLRLAAVRGHGPEEVVFVGVQPARVQVGLRLSPEVQAALPRIVEEASSVLEGWLRKETSP